MVGRCQLDIPTRLLYCKLLQPFTQLLVPKKKKRVITHLERVITRQREKINRFGKSRLPNHASPPPLYFICRYQKLYYYCTLTSASTLIFLTIWPPICLFFIKSRTWWYVNAYLHALIQLYYSSISSCSVLHWYITAPLCKFRIFLHLSFSCKVFVII